MSIRILSLNVLKVVTIYIPEILEPFHWIPNNKNDFGAHKVMRPLQDPAIINIFYKRVAPQWFFLKDAATSCIGWKFPADCFIKII